MTLISAKLGSVDSFGAGINLEMVYVATKIIFRFLR